MKVMSASTYFLTSFLQINVVNANEEGETDVLVDRLGTTATRRKMEIGTDKTKVMTNNTNIFEREIKIKGQSLEVAENCKSLGSTISNEGSKPEIDSFQDFPDNSSCF